LDYFFRGAELGSDSSCYEVANAYRQGDGIAKDSKKARYYYELAAMKGDNISRCNLGINEANDGRYDKAPKQRGHGVSLEKIKELFFEGRATKDDYEKALPSYQDYIDDIKSDQRDEAAAHHVDLRYYQNNINLL
jgi:TPR repeat protein